MTNAPTSSAHSAHVAPARIELHPIRTATLSAQQFLTGDRNGEPALLAGELRLPARGTDPYPAVLLTAQAARAPTSISASTITASRTTRTPAITRKPARNR